MSSDSEKLSSDFRRLISELLRVRNYGITNGASPVPGVVELDSERLKSVKNALRQNEELLQPFFEHLLDNYLCKDNITVRLYAVILVDEIFRRSHRFRECVIENFEEFLKYTVETDALHHPLPPPKSLAKNLKERTLKIVHNWCSTFGKAYRKLQVAYDYLKSCKTFDFQRIEAETIVERERAERERRRKQLIKERVVKKVSEDLQDMESDMQKTLIEINNGFRLLIPELSADDDFSASTSPTAIPEVSVIPKTTVSNKDIDPDQPSTSSTQSTFSPSSLHAHGFPSTTFDLSINIRIDKPSVKLDQDSIDLINNLKDCNKLIAGRYLPKVRQLLNLVSQHGGDQQLTKTLIDWRIRLDEAKKKYDDLNLGSAPVAAALDEDEADFEVVPEKEGLEEIFRPPSPDLPSHIREWSKNEAAKAKKSSGVSTVGSGREQSGDRSISTDQDRGDDRRSSIPIVPYGIDLEYWEKEKKEKPMIVRANADCHRFWRPADGEDAIECSDIEAAAYRTRVMEFVGEFQPVERECRAPLAGKESGNLCTRRDRYRCPFHGVIIDRDDQGRPLEKSDASSTDAASSSTPSTSKIFGDSDFLADVEKATGKQLATTGKKRKREPETHVDAAAEAGTARERLQKKLFNRSSIKRVAADQEALEKAKHKKKFGGQWQYVWRDQ